MKLVFYSSTCVFFN